LITLTRWILSHKLVVAGVWLILTLVGLASAQSATNALSQQFSLPGRESYQANLKIQHIYGTDPNAAVFVPVITLPAGETVKSPGVTAKIGTAFARIRAAVPHARVVSYATSGSAALVSRDGRTTYGLVYAPAGLGFNGATLYEARIRAALSGFAIGGARFHLTGLDVLASSGGGGNGPSLLLEVLLGGVGALVVLVFVFRSFMAIVPMLMAVVCIPTTFLLIWGLTAITEISFIVQFLVALIGLGVSIDYSLLVVLRWREEHKAGVPNEEAVLKAMSTAGRAVIFSGTTVAIGLLALIVLPVPFLRSVGYGGALIPLVSVTAAITLLPVALATVGPRLDWPRRGGLEAGRWWAAWARLISRWHWIAAASGLAILAILIVAAAHIRLGVTNPNALAKTGDAHAGLVALEKSGIGVGALAPFEIVVKSQDAGLLAGRLERIPDSLGVVAPSDPTWRRGGAGVIDVTPTGDAFSSATRNLFSQLKTIVHSAPGSGLVGGAPAGNFDFIDAVYGNFPLMLGLIALITFVLLSRAFRSLLLPLKAVALNILSVGAAFGIMVLIWQDGYGSKAIWGIQSTGSITSWVPIMVFAFLFGLSMDYEVFILSRMREVYDETRSTQDAITVGIGRTGRLVTSAALILFFAFIALASAPETDIKVIGTGLAAGILLDASVVRMLLVPALVSIFDRWSWWLPHWPARVLRVKPSALRAKGSVAKAGAD
jgi:putative drug exporter of the RND superfamily